MDIRVPTRAKNILEKELDDELVIVNPNTNELLALSASGQAIWERVDNHHTVDEIIELICADFGIAADAAVEQDELPDEGEVLCPEAGSVAVQVASFLEILEKKQLVSFS